MTVTAVCKCGYRCGVGDIEHDRATAYLGSDGRDPIGPAGGAHDIEAFSREPPRGGRADPAAGAGHDRDRPRTTRVVVGPERS